MAGPSVIATARDAALSRTFFVECYSSQKAVIGVYALPFARFKGPCHFEIECALYRDETGERFTDTREAVIKAPRLSRKSST